ncbi:hypothetical protein EV426DRAFT_617647, partial [Tirmania nivea]
MIKVRLGWGRVIVCSVQGLAIPKIILGLAIEPFASYSTKKMYDAILVLLACCLAISRLPLDQDVPFVLSCASAIG